MRIDTNNGSNDVSSFIGSYEKPAAAADNANNSHNGNATTPPPMPKHIPFPEYATTPELANELIMALFTTGAAILQFINIYRTNWWLPDTYITNVVNLYLIEPHMRDLILLITTRRLSYCLLIFGVKRFKHKAEEHHLLCNVLKYWFGGTQITIMGYCIYKIAQPHSYLLLFFLCYPAIVYVLIFGLQLEPFMRTAFELEGVYFNGLPMHCCTTNAVHIRDEIDTLRHDFNRRFKQIIFTSVFNAYYTGLVPCMLATTVQYNVTRAAQHIIFVCLCGFSMTAAFLLPAKYSDILHRASLHLGHWQRLDTNVERPPAPIIVTSAVNWCKHAIYANGSIVKHDNGLYRSCGPVTSAVPGNQSHVRFFKLFHNPTVIYSTLAALQASVILAEFIALSAAVEWHFLLSISFVALTNQFALNKFMRDYLITKRLYSSENAISDKHRD